MKKLFCLTFFAAFCLLGAFQISAFENQNFAFNRNSITGFIFSASRQPVSDVDVELLSDLGSTISRTKTSGSGFYSFRGLSDGRFSVKVLAYNTNFLEQTKSVSLISVSAIPGSGGIIEQVDFYLQTKKDERTNVQNAAPGVVFAQEIPKDAEVFYKQGVKFLSEKKEIEGFESLKKALEIFPDYYLALDRLGNEYILRGFNRSAYVLLTKAVAVNPKSFTSNFGLGLANFRLQQYKKAAELLQKSVEIFPDSTNANLWLGIAFIQNGELSKAEISLLKANKLSGEKSAEVHWQLAKLYNEQKKFSKSADELELFLKYNKEAKDAEKIKETIAVLRKKSE